MATNYLLSRSYQILARNKTYGIGEVDIIAKDGDVIVLVEVKAGSTTKYGLPLERVDRRKQAKLRKLAARVSQEYPDSCLRIDVIDVAGDGQVAHIISAVEAE
ncbi:YraN family protein [Candidatus Berkelbacteria bacterium]|nr:YraN family protein [Candidatus Berkelbacteria bacterium]